VVEADGGGAGAVTVEIVDDLQEIRSEWESLWNRTPDASPFQHPAWVIPWARVYAPGRCRAAALRKDGRLESLAAAFVWERTLLLAGTGPSDHSTALLAPGAETAVDELVDRLADAVHEPFDRIDLKQLPPRTALAAGSEGESCVVLALNGEDGMANVPAKMRSNWRYAVRRLERQGATVELASAEQASDAAAELKRLHLMRWNSEGQEGVIADELVQQHLRLAIAELAGAGLLRMHRLRAGGDVVAVLFAMRGGASTCYYLSGFNPAWAKLSPGTALVGTAIARAAEEGCREFDFLRGQEEYKYGWGAEDRPMGRRVMPAPARENAAACA
jgi:CelD/BcsL family acetyltransferase involved in cellulose biosynthesis